MRTFELKINTRSKNYSVIIGSNLIKNISKILAKKKIYFNKCLIVIDRNIPVKFKSALKKGIKAKKKIVYNFAPSEKSKNYDSIIKIQKILFINDFNRDDCVISFGGGITGDVIGFASSTYKRGIKFINIPSTLLSQVDSSIGGKTGINNKFGKNLIGSFYQPEIVISDIKILNSLSRRQIICGYAEIFKASLIDSYKSFKFLDDNLIKILSLEPNFIKKAILNSCILKKKIVEKDEKEKNLRKVLNLGHTFAHAYESTLNFSKKLNHGEAVILGIKNSIMFSQNKGLLNKNKYKKINNHIKKIGLLKKFNKIFKKEDLNKILKFMKTDKKNNSNKINLILIKDFGKIETKFQIKNFIIKKFLSGELNK